MGTKGWDDYVGSILTWIKALESVVNDETESIQRLEWKAEGNSSGAEKAKKDLTKAREQLQKHTGAITELQSLYKQTTKDFDKPSKRVIGHVVWSPAMSVNTPPNSFTKDVCVIKLDKARFLPNFKGNVLELGEF
jgi:hypothetical protein